MTAEPPFTNDPISVDGLPRLADKDVRPVDRRYLIGRLAGVGVTAVGAVVAGAIVSILVDAPIVPLLVTGVVLVILLLTAVTMVLEMRRLGYVLREHDISVRSGVLTHRFATVPFARVQHVSLQRGPFERMLGLATVQINSAGPDLSIPGLALDLAERMKGLIAERAGVDDGSFGQGPQSTAPPSDPFATPPTGPTAAP